MPVDALFVAYTGEKFDGHDFISAAIEAGATGILCRSDYRPADPVLEERALFFRVDDTLRAFRAIAARWRRNFDIPVVAVAGSVGKTTTKELLAAILSGKYQNILKTQGSENGFLGIPLTLTKLSATHEVAVVEIGIDEIGAMSQHLDVVEPTAGVVTAIGPEHLEKLQNLPTVAREEGLLLERLAGQEKWVVVNLDDPWLGSYSVRLQGDKVVTIKLDTPETGDGIEGDDRTLVGTYDEDTGEILFSGLGLDGLRLKCPLPGKHNARNLLAAVSLARVSADLNTVEIERGLRAFQGAAGRSELHHLPNRITVLADHYNANPTSVEAALETLRKIEHPDATGPGRLWACLGDMLELGPMEKAFHKELAGPIAEAGVKGVFLYGERMKWLEEELKNREFKGQVRHFTKHNLLAESLKQELKPGDKILIKGSRGMRMEEVWNLLRAK